MLSRCIQNATQVVMTVTGHNDALPYRTKVEFEDTHEKSSNLRAHMYNCNAPWAGSDYTVHNCASFCLRSAAALRTTPAWH